MLSKKDRERTLFEGTPESCEPIYECSSDHTMRSRKAWRPDPNTQPPSATGIEAQIVQDENGEYVIKPKPE